MAIPTAMKATGTRMALRVVWTGAAFNGYVAVELGARDVMTERLADGACSFVE